MQTPLALHVFILCWLPSWLIDVQADSRWLGGWLAGFLGECAWLAGLLFVGLPCTVHPYLVDAQLGKNFMFLMCVCVYVCMWVVELVVGFVSVIIPDIGRTCYLCRKNGNGLHPNQILKIQWLVPRVCTMTQNLTLINVAGDESPTSTNSSTWWPWCVDRSHYATRVKPGDTICTECPH